MSKGQSSSYLNSISGTQRPSTYIHTRLHQSLLLPNHQSHWHSRHRPSGWDTGKLCVRMLHIWWGVNVMVCPLWCLHYLFELILFWAEPSVWGSIISQSCHPCLYHLTDPIGQSSPSYIIISCTTGKLVWVLSSAQWYPSDWSLRITTVSECLMCSYPIS